MRNGDDPETVGLDLIDDAEWESVDPVTAGVVLARPPQTGAFPSRLDTQFYLRQEFLPQQGPSFLVESDGINQLSGGEPVIDDAFHATCCGLWP